MERDSLLAHGASFCLNDRLMKCSDYSEGYVCRKCGSIISCYLNKEILKNQMVINAPNGGATSQDAGSQPQHYNITQSVYCRVCDAYDCKKISIPYVLRYMTNELSAMNIKMKFDTDADYGVKEISTAQ